MNFINRLTIKKKLRIGSFIFLFFFLLNGLFSYYYSVETRAYLNPVRVSNVKNADLLKRSLKDIELAYSDLVSTGEVDYQDQASKLTSQFHKILKILKSNDPAELNLLSIIEVKFQEYIETSNTIAATLIKDAPHRQLRPLAEKLKEILPLLKKDIDNLINKKYDDFLEILRQTESISKQHVSTDLSLALLVLLICIVALPFIIRSIIVPLDNLVQVTKKLGEGKLDTRAIVTADDEIGVLAQSFNYMSESLQEKNKKLEDTTDNLKNLLQEQAGMEIKIRKTNEELRNANSQLKEVDRHKSEFLASMSHELRTPLNAIINFTDQVIEDWEDLYQDAGWNAEAKDMLVRVLKSSNHLLSLINDLLDIAKIESGKTKLDIDETDLTVLILDTLENVRPLAYSKGISLESDIKDNIPPCWCDERKIKQVIINLLSNAIKFTDKGKVTAKVFLVDTPGKGVIIEVIDTGMGIPENSIKIIFDRFRQVDGSDSRKHQGTGLGLNLVKEIVKLHNGYTKVASIVGKGSCFSVYIPLNTGATEKII